MAEKTKQIKADDLEQGFFLKAECCMCNDEKTFAGTTKKEVLEEIKSEGWKEIDSDAYGKTGYYCGCDYMD